MPNGGPYWAVQDMDVLSHEISEWSDDPFATNNVEPWPWVPGSPQYGCSNPKRASVHVSLLQVDGKTVYARRWWQCTGYPGRHRDLEPRTRGAALI